MKKFFVAFLALMFVFNSSGIILAAPANPFGDVPARHWSHGAVDHLFKAGIIDGFEGGFQADKTMTRYQMAQMVARAIWNKDKANQDDAALIAKLAKEYANELDRLGVALDQPVSPVNTVQENSKTLNKVTFSGDARLRYVNAAGTKFAERLRLNMSTDINEDVNLFTRFVLLNNNKVGTYKTSKDTDRFNVADAAFNVRNFYGTDLTIGRFSQMFDNYGYWMNTTGGVDGFKVTVGNKVKVTAGYANFAPYAAMQLGETVEENILSSKEIHDAFFIRSFYDTSKATKVGFWWLKEQEAANRNFDVKSVNVVAKLSSKVTVGADYGRNSVKTDGKNPDFFHLRATYGTINTAKPGTWNVAIDYRNFEKGANSSVYTTSMVGSVADAKGWALIGNTVVKKNITLSGFYGFGAKKISTGDSLDNYARMQFDILF